jgi:arabinofuranosyltransferase
MKGSRLARFQEFCTTNFTGLLWTVIAGLTLFAWFNRFIQDDAFISFRYADNFVRGHGLVWNIGDRVEGYTNFLWTLLISAGLAVGLEPVTYSFAVGLLCFVGTLYFTFRTAVLVLESRAAALATTFVLGCNYTFSSYATGGLETPMQAFLVILTTFLTLHRVQSGEWKPRLVLALSLSSAALVLTRLDSTLIVAIILAVAALSIILQQTPITTKVRNLLLLVAPLAAIVGVWMVWKKSYYGEWLPNTYYAKLGTPVDTHRGEMYLLRFFNSYWLSPFLLMCVLGLLDATRRVLVAVRRKQPMAAALPRVSSRSRRRYKRTSPLGDSHAVSSIPAPPPLLATPAAMLAILLAICALWCAYVRNVGGDFMEFRFMVPILPILFIAVGYGLFITIRWLPAQIALVLVLLAGSVWHARTFQNTPDLEIETFKSLKYRVTGEFNDWAGVGKGLGKLFNYDPSVSFAAPGIGALGYYSRLTLFDAHGLTDRWVARNGLVISTRPGHQRLATVQYLAQQKVNLIVGRPTVMYTNRVFLEDYPNHDFEIAGANVRRGFPLGSQIIEIHYDGNHKIAVLYLTRSPIVNKAIQEHGWSVYPVPGN